MVSSPKIESFKEGYFPYKGYQSFFIEGGEGPAIVFLHPLGGSHELWKRNMHALLPHFHVLAFDFLGFGKSDKPDIPYALGDFVEHVMAFMTDRKVEKTALVGNSLGGHVAILAAYQHPTRVQAVVLANSSGLRSLSGSAVFRSVSLSARLGHKFPIKPTGFLVRHILKVIHGTSGQATAELARYYSGQLKGKDSKRWIRAFVRALEAIVTTPLDVEVKEVDQPVLIIWGGRDRLLGIHGGEVWAKSFQNATLKVFEEVGHFPQLEAPDLFNEAISTFLRAKLAEPPKSG